ncbi:MAG: ABC transporter permease [Candidatus Dormibacteria bacterium]
MAQADVTKLELAPLSSAGAVHVDLSEVEPDARELTYGQLALRRFLRHRLATVSMAFLALLALAAILIPWLYPDQLHVQDLQNLYQPPFQGFDHILGTDDLGRDEFVRVMFGGRISLTVGVVAVGILLSVGLALGALAGFYGSWVDNVLMRVTDVVLALPLLILIICVTTVVGGPSLWVLIIVIGAFSWSQDARLIRSQFLSLRTREFVEAARALGASDFRIIWRHLIPNAIAPNIVSATLGVANIILLEAALSFIGYGLPPETPSWGSLLNNYEAYYQIGQYWLILFPSLLLVLTALSINFIGDGLRDALDPRQK